MTAFAPYSRPWKILFQARMVSAQEGGGLLRSLALALLLVLPSSAAFGLEYDVYLFGGQSNMEGVGRSSFLTPGQASQPGVKLYHSSSVGNSSNAGQWVTMQPAGWQGVAGGFGPEIAFSDRLSQLQPTRNIAVIKHAVGGTSLALNWKTTGTVGSQYAAFSSTVQSALSELQAEGHTYSIKGMLWQQGEEDAKWGPAHLHSTVGDMSGNYADNLAVFIDSVRNLVSTPDMPFVYGNVLPDPAGTSSTDIPGRFPFRDVVRLAEVEVDQDSGASAAVSGAYLVSTDTFGLHGSNSDGFRDSDFVHFDEQGLLDLGYAYAEKIHAVHAVPEPVSASLFVTALVISGVVTGRRSGDRRRSDCRSFTGIAAPAVSLETLVKK